MSHFGWPITISFWNIGTIPKIKMLRRFPLAHLLGYESSILGKTYCLLCGAIGNMLGFTHWELVEHMWGISLGTFLEHKIQKISKFPLDNELLSPKGEKIGPPRCMLSCHFNWLHENLIFIKLIVTIFGQGHYPFAKSVHRSNILNVSHFLMQNSRCLPGYMTLNSSWLFLDCPVIMTIVLNMAWTIMLLNA